MLVASSRMYNVAPPVRAAWDDFFAWLSRSSSVGLAVVAHAPPAPLAELWERPDLGAAFMCGYPFVALEPARRPVALAAPVAAAAWARGGPLYASHIVVAGKSAVKTTEDLRGAVLGWTVRDSQSGYHALRRFLVESFPKEAGRVFAGVEGPFLNPAGMIEAVVTGVVDAGPVDAYAFELLRMHAPEAVGGVRVLATTTSTPGPLLVAARAAPERDVEALRHALLTAHEEREGAERLKALGLLRFAGVVERDYLELPQSASRVAGQGLAEW